MPVITITKENYDAEVLASDKTVLLDFWASWCGPCRMLSPTVDAIAEERPDIKVGKVNVDEQNELAAQFGIMSIPTLVVIKNGQIVTQSYSRKNPFWRCSPEQTKTAPKIGAVFSFSVVIVFADRAFRIVEVMHRAAFRTRFLRKSILLHDTVLRCKKFQLHARRADIDLDRQRARDEIRQVPENPARFAELDARLLHKLHRYAAAQTVNLSHVLSPFSSM